jgi:hypothetical protein
MKISILLATLLCLPGLASAADFKYTFLEGGYVSTELDVGPVDVDGDGLGVRGSFEFAEEWYAFAGLADLEFDFGVDGTQLEFGAGWHNPINQDVDLIAEVGYVSVDLDSGFGSADDDGFGVGVGVRAQAWEQVQLEAGIAYVNLEDSDTSVNFAGRYNLTQTLALALGLSLSDDATGWTLGFRADF